MTSTFGEEMSQADIDFLWGGYYASKEEGSDQFGAFRLLDFNRDAYHAALFNEKFDELPTVESLRALSPFIGHVPIDSRALLRERELQLIGGSPLTEEDLEGYMIYLEHHEMSKEERTELANNLLGFSTEPPLRLRLHLVEDELAITELP